ncbi:ketopantoate reductase family protein [Yoonia sp.]|uniref:ketopantoate reductase family protein n=1 Tax=Yoonia sp. TaxID=2212373 RepID=UPI0035C8498B
MTDQKVSIFGGGSVGLCLAANFVKAGAQVTLLVRKGVVEHLQDSPITVTGLLGDHQIAPGAVSICDAANPDADVLSCEMLVLTTKAYDVADALAPFAGQTTCPPVLLLQNGMGSAEIARDILGPDVPIFSSAMMIGMVRHNPTEVEVTAMSSPILCGPLLGDDTASLVRMIDIAKTGFVPMEYDPHIRDTISFKLLFNTCMNPTGAITGQTFGELLSDPQSRALIVGLADETLAVFDKAYGYRPAKSGQHYVDDILSKIIFPNGAGHRSSMLQDVQSGRQTEIDFATGAVIRLANSVDLPAIRHQSILQLITARTSKL